MKRILLSLLASMMFLLPVTAGEIYTYKDKNGITVISNVPPPENAKIEHRSSYQQSTAAEIQQYEAQRRLNAIKEEIRSENARTINEANERHQRIVQERQENIQRQNEEKAKRLKNAVRAETDRLNKAKSNGPGEFAYSWNATIEARKKKLKNDPERYFEEKSARQDRVRNSSYDTGSNISVQNKVLRGEKNVIDAYTGLPYIPAAGGVIHPKTGTFYHKTAGGYVDTKTGKFVPAQ